MKSKIKPVILKRSAHVVSRKQIDPDALKVLYRLHRHGHKAYLVGGAVRDLLLDKKPKDFDVVTDAHPGQIKKLFSNAYLIGRRFRLVHIRFKGKNIIEVATFRREPEEDDADHNNTFGSPQEDAFRRDITINGLFYDIADYSILDYVGGLADLQAGRIRIIGDPHVRYQDDPVRMWRVLRHASRLDFAIERSTAAAIGDHLDLLGGCSGARLFEELNKDIKSGHMVELASLLRVYGILPILLGSIGALYAQDNESFERLNALLAAMDAAALAGDVFAPDIQYTLLFWPWARQMLDNLDPGLDRGKVLQDAFMQSGMTITVPKSLRAGVLQTMVILERMFSALETGRMRWSLKKRTRWADAAFVFALLQNGVPPHKGRDAFELAFNERHAGAAKPRRRRRRPRKTPPTSK